MTTYRRDTTKADDRTNVLACVADDDRQPQGEGWVECEAAELFGFDRLYRQAGVTYYGRM